MFLQAEKDVDARLKFSGRKGLQSEVRDSLNSDGVLLVVQGEENMGDVLELLSWGFYREDIFPDEEHGFQEGLELDCPAMACALGVFAGPKAEVEPQLDQVENMLGFWFGG